MAVRLNDSTRIYFYTKVQSGSGYHLDDYLAFVLKFHNNLFDKATMDENASYLETSADTIDDNLESVSINSGREAVSFGNMEVKQETKPRITLQEMNNTYTVIREYNPFTEISDGVIQYYDLSETYKLRYTADRMYLLIMREQWMLIIMNPSLIRPITLSAWVFRMKRISVTFILIKGTECALLWKVSSGIMTISLLICTRYTALLQKIFQI